MKTILNFKDLNTVLIILIVCILNACSDEMKYDITGDSTNKVYVKTPTSYVNKYNFSILHTPISSNGNITATFPARCTQEAATSLSVTFAMDNSLIDAFNKANSTTYSTVPAGLVELTNPGLTIPKGAMSSSDSITISIPGAVLSQLTDDAYVVPVKITTISNSNEAAISSNLNTVYVVITTGWTNCYDSPLIGDMAGILITPRTGWAATIDVTLYSGLLTQLFDGSTSSYWQIRPPTKYNLVVNLASEYTGITGIRTNSNSTSYGLTKVIIYSSSDGVSWVTQGSPTLSTSSAYQYIKFYAPIIAQYIKIETVTFRSTSRTYMGEFDVYRNI